MRLATVSTILTLQRHASTWRASPIAGMHQHGGHLPLHLPSLDGIRAPDHKKKMEIKELFPEPLEVESEM
jgi:ribosomal protein S4E